MKGRVLLKYLLISKAHGISYWMFLLKFFLSVSKNIYLIILSFMSSLWFFTHPVTLFLFPIFPFFFLYQTTNNKQQTHTNYLFSQSLHCTLFETQVGWRNSYSTFANTGTRTWNKSFNLPKFYYLKHEGERTTQ